MSSAVGSKIFSAQSAWFRDFRLKCSTPSAISTLSLQFQSMSSCILLTKRMWGKNLPNNCKNLPPHHIFPRFFTNFQRQFPRFKKIKKLIPFITVNPSELDNPPKKTSDGGKIHAQYFPNRIFPLFFPRFFWFFFDFFLSFFSVFFLIFFLIFFLVFFLIFFLIFFSDFFLWFFSWFFFLIFSVSVLWFNEFFQFNLIFEMKFRRIYRIKKQIHSAPWITSCWARSVLMSSADGNVTDCASSWCVNCFLSKPAIPEMNSWWLRSSLMSITPKKRHFFSTHSMSNRHRSYSTYNSHRPHSMYNRHRPHSMYKSHMPHSMSKSHMPHSMSKSHRPYSMYNRHRSYSMSNRHMSWPNTHILPPLPLPCTQCTENNSPDSEGRRTLTFVVVGWSFTWSSSFLKSGPTFGTASRLGDGMLAWRSTSMSA